jgi:hypothetical protein
MKGELALILSAMRNRAHQTVNKEDEDEDSEDSEGDDHDETGNTPEFLFKDELRYPVCNFVFV